MCIRDRIRVDIGKILRKLCDIKGVEIIEDVYKRQLYNTACKINERYVSELAAQVDGDIDTIAKQLEDTDIADDQRMETFILILSLTRKTDAAKYMAARLLETYFINPEKEKKEKTKKAKKTEEK